MIELQACPLCKKKIQQLHSHLRNKHHLSARERRPYMKIGIESAVKHKDTVLNKTDIIVTEFEEQKFSLDNDFKDIEDLIVTSYLKKPSLPRTVSIRETIRSQIFPLYMMVKHPSHISTCAYI